MFRWVKSLLVIGGILLSISTSSAEVPWKQYRYFKNYGGINDNLASTEIADNEATDLQNVVFDTGGQIIKRYGYETIPSGAVKVTTGTTVCVNGLAYYKQADGDRYLVAVLNSDNTLKFRYLPYQSGGSISAPWIDVTSGSVTSFSNNYLPTFAVASDSLLIAVPTTLSQRPYVFTGGTIGYLNSDTDTPYCSIISYHKNHLFTNDASRKSRLWFSGLGQVWDFTPTDFIDIGSDDGSSITGLISAYGGLYIFKEKSIWLLSGYDRDSWQLNKMVDMGCYNQQSITMANNIIYFMNNQGSIVAYTGGYNIEYISSKIGNTLDDINSYRFPYFLSLTYPEKDGDVYFGLATADSSTNDRVLLYDTTYNSWLKFSGITPNSWCVGDDADGKNSIFFGDYSGYVHQYPSTNYYDGNVATSAIESFYQTKWFNYPEIEREKYWRLLKTYVLSETSTDTYLTVNMRSDYETGGDIKNIQLTRTGALWDAATWDIDIFGGQQLIMDRKEVDKGIDMFQVKFSNNELNHGFTLLGYSIVIEPTDKL
jgi:hypothetical protein